MSNKPGKTRFSFRFCQSIWELEIPVKWEPLLRAQFGHLEVESNAPPEVQISCSDGDGQRRSMFLAMRQKHQVPPLEILSSSQGEEVTMVTDSTYSYFHKGDHQGAFEIFDGPIEEAILGGNIFLKFFSWYARSIGVAPLHCACLGIQGNYVLLPANSGSGKSTTAFSSYLGGLEVLSDDFCFVRQAGGKFHVFGVYNSSKLRPQARAMVTEQIGLPEALATYTRKDGKTIYFAPTSPGQPSAPFSQEGELIGIIVPSITDQPPGPHPIDSSEVVHGFSSSFQLLAIHGGDVRHIFRTVTDMMRQIPSYSFTLSPDLKLNTAKLKSFLSDLSQS